MYEDWKDICADFKTNQEANHDQKLMNKVISKSSFISTYGDPHNRIDIVLSEKKNETAFCKTCSVISTIIKVMKKCGIKAIDLGNKEIC